MLYTSTNPTIDRTHNLAMTRHYVTRLRHAQPSYWHLGSQHLTSLFFAFPWEPIRLRVARCHYSTAPTSSMGILAYMAFCEVSQDQSPGTPAAAGDFGFKVLTSSDPAEKTKKLSAELANGRLGAPVNSLQFATSTTGQTGSLLSTDSAIMSDKVHLTWCLSAKQRNKLLHAVNGNISALMCLLLLLC